MVLIREETYVKKYLCNINRINQDESGVNSTSGSFETEILIVLGLHESKWILCLITYNTVIIYYLCGWITSTNSIALSAYANTVVFNIFALLVCLISVWVSRNSSLSSEPHDSELTTTSSLGHLKYFEYRPNCGGGCCIVNSPAVNFVDISNTNDKILEMPSNGRSGRVSLSILGAEKYEVLALFVSASLILASSASILINIIQRLGYQPNIHTARLGLGASLGILAHLGTALAYPDARLNHVVCTALPCPTWNGCNPILGGNIISTIILFITHIVIDFWNLHVADTAAAFVVIGLTVTSMLPLAIHTLSVILQKVPHHMIVQLDRCLREALNIDGVVEFRNERFWTRSFGKLAGSLHVRIRQNANENYVMENITKHLSKVFSSLNIHQFHDLRLHGTTSINNMQTETYPLEYYINEILPNVKNETLPRWNNELTSPLDQQDVKVMKIDRLLNITSNNINNSIHLATFASANINSSSTRSSDSSNSSSSNSCIRTVTEEMTQRRDDKFFTFTNSHHDGRTMKLATIFWNENVRVNDYLYRE